MATGISTDPMYPVSYDPEDWYGQDDWDADWEAAYGTRDAEPEPEVPGGIVWVEDPAYARYGDVQRHGRVAA